MKFNIIFVLIFIFANLLIAEEYHLEDGSIIFGEPLTEYYNPDSIYVNNVSVGLVKIPRDALKFEGVNLTDGTFWAYTKFPGEDNNSFSQSHSFTIKNSNARSSVLTTSLGVSMTHNKFNKTASHTLTLQKDYEGQFIQVSHWDTNSNYDYDSYFLVPALSLEVNPLPRMLRKYISKFRLYPYLGIGGGYGLAYIKFQRITNSDMHENFQGDDIQFNNSNIKNDPYLYSGLMYNIGFGCALKLTSKIVICSEISYMKANFTQRYSKDSESEQFNLSGLTPSIGIRFGSY